MSYLKYNPSNGLALLPDSVSASMWRNLYPGADWYYNPWTGTYRDPRDIASDPEGIAIVPPGEPIASALKAAQSTADVATFPPGEEIRAIPSERHDEPITAPDILAQARKHMEDRAATYDKPEGERSMAATVDAFNTITGRDVNISEAEQVAHRLRSLKSNLTVLEAKFASDQLKAACEQIDACIRILENLPPSNITESEGWLLMALLKMVRSQQRQEPHRDSLEDLVAYAALLGEARLGGR